MNFILFLSNCMIPLVIIYVVGLGLLMRLNIFDIFLEGVKDGLKTVMGILPTLIRLLTAVGVLRAADIFEYIGRFFEPVIKGLSMAPEVLSLIFIKLFSSTAATGMMLDIFTEYGVVPEMAGFRRWYCAVRKAVSIPCLCILCPRKSQKHAGRWPGR